MNRLRQIANRLAIATSALAAPCVAALILVCAAAGAFAETRAPLLTRFLAETSPGELVAGADAFGAVRDDAPVAPVLAGGETVGYAFVTSDFVGTTGYSGKPIHILAAISPKAKLLGVRLMEHSEPIVLIGIPDRKIKKLTEGYAGMDLVAEAAAGGSAHDLDIISGATVTIMVIDDSIVRSGIKVARALGLGGLAPAQASGGPRYVVKPEAGEPRSWLDLSGDGAIRRLSLDVGQINAAFESTGDERAISRPEKGDDADVFIDLQTALVSVPAIGLSLLGEAEYANLTEWLAPGEHAILVAGRGRYSFKGSGYVRGGIFDRIQLIQGDFAVRFTDKQHHRIGALAADGAPSFNELDLFKIPADAGFDPAEPWRLQLLVQRAVGAVEKSYLTFDLDYRLPGAYLRPLAQTAAPSQVAEQSEAEAKQALWRRVWMDRAAQIGGLLAMLTVLTGAFFFQKQVTRREPVVFWFRIGFLSLTLVFLGWGANAQLSVVNLMALGNALATGFSWDAFLLDPLVFILWFSVAVALIFWGRGAYCGWLCPFGALQELTNRLAKLARIPQWELPWGLHERLWPIKYMIFLGLFGLSLASIEMAEHYAEIEPFKTAIILKFQRNWPFVLFAVGILGIGLFVERFYCRYLCPLGAALAIPGRMRMFDWLKRYRECGDPCQICAKECMVQAINPLGEINPNECLYCLHCQVLYQDDQKCPVCIKVRKKREKFAQSTAHSGEALARATQSQNHPNLRRTEQ